LRWPRRRCLRYRVPHSERLAWIFDLGAYRDSGRNTALMAGAGGLWNRGKTVLAPLPLAAFETRSVTFNFVYFPGSRRSTTS
jgi:hypothetical protein